MGHVTSKLSQRILGQWRMNQPSRSQLLRDRNRVAHQSITTNAFVDAKVGKQLLAPYMPRPRLELEAEIIKKVVEEALSVNVAAHNPPLIGRDDQRRLFRWVEHAA